MSTSPQRFDRDDLLARTDLGRVLDALTAGAGDGFRRKWHCPDPDHPDVHPSVTIRTDQRGVERWRCWSGGHGGTAIDAVIVARRLPALDAMRWLDEHYAHLQPIERTPAPPARPIGEPAAEVVEYVERCAKLLWTGSGREVREWLNARGYPDEILHANLVGADPGRRYLPRPKGFPAGWPAAVYPVLDPDGAVTYFQARYLDPPVGRGKYDNPANHWATNPRLGWVSAPHTRDHHDATLVVTEGIADALAAATLGHHAVGVLGTAAFDHHAAQRLHDAASSWATRVIVCFDADPPGQAAARRVADELHRVGLNNETMEPPGGMDLTDWATELRHDPFGPATVSPPTPPTLPARPASPAIGTLSIA